MQISGPKTKRARPGPEDQPHLGASTGMSVAVHLFPNRHGLLLFLGTGQDSTSFPLHTHPLKSQVRLCNLRKVMCHLQAHVQVCLCLHDGASTG